MPLTPVVRGLWEHATPSNTCRVLESADDRAVVEAINQVAGTGLALEGRAEKGTSGGAMLVAMPDGREAVVTRFLGPLAEAHRTARVLAHAFRNQLPVARYHLVVPVGDDVFLVQERLLGRPPAAITPAVISAIIEVNERFAHALQQQPDVPQVELCLTNSGLARPRHEVLARHSDRSRAILNRIRRIGRTAPDVAAGDDLVHIDLTPDNVLFDDHGAITGVIDWNLGVYRGDRHLALVKTRFDLEWCLHEQDHHDALDDAADTLDAYLDAAVGQHILKTYWAHRMLYQLYFTLPNAPADVIDWHLDVAEVRLR